MEVYLLVASASLIEIPEEVNPSSLIITHLQTASYMKPTSQEPTMKTYTPQQAYEILSLAEESQGLFERPWLDDVITQLTIQAVNLSWLPEQEEEYLNNQKVQSMISQIDGKDYYKKPSSVQKILKSGRISRKWSRSTREKKYGVGPSK